MKLTQEEIGKTIDSAIGMIAAARYDSSLLPQEARDFADKLTDGDKVRTHVSAVTIMEMMAKVHGIPEEVARTATFISAAWIGYKLREAEEAKQQVADLQRMASQ